MRHAWMTMLALIAMMGVAIAKDEDPCSGGESREDPCSGGESSRKREKASDSPPSPEPTDAAGSAEGSSADAAGYPVAYIARPLVLPKGMLALHGVLRISLTAESVGSPIWIAPSAYYGVMPKLQVGIVHDPGLCFLGDHDLLGTTVDACRGNIYNDIAFDGLYTVVDKPEKHFVLAGHATLGAREFDPDVLLALRAGVLGRYALASKVALIFDPAIRFGLASRSKANKELFDLPVQLLLQATTKLALFAETGFQTPLAEITDSYYVTLGFAGLYALRPNLDVGARFTFPRLVGGTATGTNASADTRQLDLFITFRR